MGKFLGRWSAFAWFALGIGLGCAPVTIVPSAPHFGVAAVRLSTFAPAAVTEQSAKVSVRKSPRGYDARLSERLVCRQTRVEQQSGYRVLERRLSTTDNILMWTGLAGAGVTAGLIGVGIARGQDPNLGGKLFGVYGVPLGALGAFEWWRSRPVTEPVTRTRTVSKSALMACPRGSDEINVDIYSQGVTLTSAWLSPMWRPVTLAPDKAVSVDARTLLPLSSRKNKAAIFLPALAVRQAPAPSASDDAVCTNLGQKIPAVGWIAQAFYNQPVRSEVINQGDSLADLAEKELGAPDLVWQLYELNQNLGKTSSNVYTGASRSIKVPRAPQSTAAWKAKLPSQCE